MPGFAFGALKAVRALVAAGIPEPAVGACIGAMNDAGNPRIRLAPATPTAYDASAPFRRQKENGMTETRIARLRMAAASVALGPVG